MSTRTSISVVTPSSYPEAGVALTTLANSDVSNGNKFTANERTQLYAENGSGSSKTLTFTHSHRGATVTRVVTLADGEKRLMGPFPREMTQHDGDADQAQVWVSANGVAGDVKLRAIQNVRPL